MSDARGTGTIMGTTIGRHRISRLIGGGTVGRVFACRTPDDDRNVAIKVLRTKYSNLGERLLRDRLLLDKIVAPHVVHVEEVAVYSNAPYIVMELVEGESLGVLLQKGPLRTVDAIEVARAMALGLQAAWAHGIPHGDVRPANVLLPAGDLRRAKMVDFLLAPPIEGTDSVRGNPGYLAPELLVGTPPDPLTDLYALGCTLYEILVGRPPFTGAPSNVLNAHVHLQPTSLASALPGAPQGLVDLVDRLLEKDRAKRMKTYVECLAGVERALKGLSLPDPAPPQIPDFDLDLGDMQIEDEGRTDEFHLSPAQRQDIISDEIVLPTAKKPASSTGIPMSPPPTGPKPAPIDGIGVYRSAKAAPKVEVSGPLPDAPPPDEPVVEEIEERTQVNTDIAGPRSNLGQAPKKR